MKDREMSISRLLPWVLVVSMTVIAAGLWYVYHKVKNSRFYELGNKIPGPKALPLIGNAHLAWGMDATGE